MNVKSTFPASNGPTLRLWRTADAAYQGLVLPKLPVCAKLNLKGPVIWWMSVYCNFVTAIPAKVRLPFHFSISASAAIQCPVTLVTAIRNPVTEMLLLRALIKINGTYGCGQMPPFACRGLLSVN